MRGAIQLLRALYSQTGQGVAQGDRHWGDIRKCREEMMSHEAAPKIGKIYLPALFMRLAEGGDLLFHVQERCYTLLQLSEIFRS